MIAEYRERRPGGRYPPIILNSINLTAIVRLVEANDFAGVAPLLVLELGVLERPVPAFAEALKARTGMDGLILGGTELPLILRDPTISGVPVLDTTRIHVNAALSQALDN